MTIVEEKVREGGSGLGVNFSCDISGWGGVIIGGFTPHNYTDECWVSRRDPEAIAERWRVFKQGCDPISFVKTIHEHYGDVVR